MNDPQEVPQNKSEQERPQPLKINCNEPLPIDVVLQHAEIGMLLAQGLTVSLRLIKFSVDRARVTSCSKKNTKELMEMYVQCEESTKSFEKLQCFMTPAERSLSITLLGQHQLLILEKIAQIRNSGAKIKSR